jgi:hypothetical protein
MVEPAGGAGFDVEAAGDLLGREQRRVDDLDRDRASERLLLGPVDAAHAADGRELEDDVRAGDRAAHERIDEHAGRLRRGAAEGTEPCRSGDLLGALSTTCDRHVASHGGTAARAR